MSDILLIYSLIILSLEHALLFFSGLIYILKFHCPLYLNLKFRHCYFTVHPHITVNGCENSTFIMKTLLLYNFDPHPLERVFYIVKLMCTGVYIIFLVLLRCMAPFYECANRYVSCAGFFFFFFFFYECAKKLLSFARFNCAIFNFFYR